MIISFIGMSGAGKSAWSIKLEKEEKFRRYSCDDLIEKELAPELKQLGYKGTSGLSQWLGQPYDERYKKNSRKYLELEAKSLTYILDEIKKSNNENIVVDTTGSAIYMPSKLLAILKKQTKIIYLETPEIFVEKMIERYIADPKPVIWGNMYKPLAGEKKEDTLKRCYSKLLKHRTKLYEKLGVITIDYRIRTRKDFKAHNLLALIAKDQNKA